MTIQESEILKNPDASHQMGDSLHFANELRSADRGHESEKEELGKTLQRAVYEYKGLKKGKNRSKSINLGQEEEKCDISDKSSAGDEQHSSDSIPVTEKLQALAQFRNCKRSIIEERKRPLLTQ